MGDQKQIVCIRQQLGKSTSAWVELCENMGQMDSKSILRDSPLQYLEDPPAKKEFCVLFN